MVGTSSLRGLWFAASPGKKGRPHLNQQKLGMVVHTSSYVGSIKRKIEVQASLYSNMRPYLKNT
jgi:hypothetical protein